MNNKPIKWHWLNEVKDKYEDMYADGLVDQDRQDILEVEDIYPGYSECGTQLVINVTKANARLIAAAPEMYEVLRELSYQDGIMQTLCMHNEELQDKIMDILAKAEATHA